MERAFIKLLYTVIVKEWRLLFIVVGLFALLSIVIALMLPNYYKASATVFVKPRSGGGGIVEMASRFSGLAGLAGIDIGSANEALSARDLVIARMNSLDFYEQYIYEAVLVELMAYKNWDAPAGKDSFDKSVYLVSEERWIRDVSYPQTVKPSAQESHEAFMDDYFRVRSDAETGFLIITVEHQSPVIARKWVDLVLMSLTESLRARDVEEAQRAIYFLNEERGKTSLVAMEDTFSQLIEEQTKTIMLANATQNYVFDIIQPAFVPEEKSRPFRALICITVTFFGVVVAVMTALWKRRDLLNQLREIN
jgi:uncharacterized protein involved in exopolysaccharide biosynthesis